MSRKSSSKRMRPEPKTVLRVGRSKLRSSDYEVDPRRIASRKKVIQAILRHSNVNVTLAYYAKSASSDVQAAMGRFEQELAVQTLQDTKGDQKLIQAEHLNL